MLILSLPFSCRCDIMSTVRGTEDKEMTRWTTMDKEMKKNIATTYSGAWANVAKAEKSVNWDKVEEYWEKRRK